MPSTHVSCVGIWFSSFQSALHDNASSFTLPNLGFIEAEGENDDLKKKENLEHLCCLPRDIGLVVY